MLKSNPTLCDSIDGTGENYAKWNKPGSEEQVPYDLTFNWNISNRRKKQTKYNQRHWNWNKLTVIRGEVGEDNGGEKGEGFQEHV